MKLQQEIDHSTLSWVKKELDLTLKQAEEALEAYSEDRDDSSQMRFCATYLHQVQGTLRMVELYGAALLVEEMERLAVDLLEGRIDQEDSAFEVLMHGMLRLPDYLDGLLAGRRDMPVVLLPIVNEIRALRGDTLATEGVLFNPDLSRGVPDDLPRPARRYADKVLKPNIAKLRSAYQVGLLKWFRDGASEDLYRRMGLLFERLLSVSSEPVLRQLFWVTGGVIDALRHGGLELSNSVKSLFGKVDRELRNLALNGERHFAQHRPEPVINSLLYYVAQAEAGGELVQRIKQHFDLDSLIYTEDEQQETTEQRPSRDVLLAVGQALKEELLGIKEQLDLLLRKQETCASELNDLLPVLKKVRETLAMLGIGFAQSTVEDQIERIESLQQPETTLEETDLLEMAGALLTVESALEDYIHNLGRMPAEESAPLPSSEQQQLLDDVVREANANLDRVKQALVGFIEAPWDHQALEGLPEQLKQVAGALKIMEMDKPAEVLAQVGDYVGEHLLARKKIPSTRQLELLADAIAGMEYFMEALSERRSTDQVMGYIADALDALHRQEQEEASERQDVSAGLDITPEGADEVLEGWSVSEDLLPDTDATPSIEPDQGLVEDLDERPGAAPVDEVLQEDAGVELPHFDGEQPSDAEDAQGVEPEAMEMETVDSADAVGDVPQGESDAVDLPPAASEVELPEVIQAEVDVDILEVFTEEMQEEIDNLQTQYRRWSEDEMDQEALASMRRSFHTLKGSGRLVGARRTGEFSWHMENMLNRLIEGNILRSPQLMRLLQHTIDHTLPALYTQLTGSHGDPDEDRLRLQMYLADRLAQGQPVEDAWLDWLEGVAPGKHETGTASDMDAHPGQAGADMELDVPVEDDVQDEGEAEREPETEPADAMDAPEAVDDELLAIFEGEAEQHLKILQDWMEQDGGQRQVTEAARIAAHTLNGAASMTKAEAIVALTGPLEGVLRRLHSQSMSPDEQGWALIGQAVTALRQQINQLIQRRPVSTDEALAHRLAQLRDTLPTHTPEAEPGPGPDEPQPAQTVAALVDEPVAEIELDELGDGDAPDGEEALSAADDEPVAEIELDELGDGDAPDGEGALSAADDEPVAEIELDELDDADALDGEEALSAADDEPVAEIELGDLDDTGVLDDEAAVLAELDQAAKALDAMQAQQEETGQDDTVAAAQPEQTEAEQATETDLETGDGPVDGSDEPPAAEGQPEPVSLEPGTVDDAEAATEPEAAPDESEPEQSVAQAPQAEAPLELDPELVSIFLEEAQDVTGELDRALEQWQAEPNNREPVDALQRSLHTLKGGARTIGLDELGELAHQMESVLMAVQQGSIQPDADSIALEVRAFDHLQENIDRVARGVQPRVDEDLLHSLRQQASGVEAAPAAEAEQRRLERLEEMEAEREAAERQQEQSAEPPVEIPPEDGPRRAPSSVVRPRPLMKPEATGQQELIRVRSDLLDKLVNFAGEVSIYRARLEQQMGDFRFNLEELQQTVVRLRDQFRKLEIETEAQIRSRYQREHELNEEDEAFDPLELDRFSAMQQLSRALSESVNDLVSIQEMLDQITRESETLLLQQSRVSTELQEGLMQTRMVSFETLVPRLRRIVRQTARELGKKAVLRVEGAEGEMDRNILERITAPLEHTLRNAVAHGIETPEDRQRLGKPEEGEIRIEVGRDATDVVIRIEDDGAGIDTERVRAKAVEQGLIAPDTDLSEQEIFGLIMESGFSTADEVSRIAGRGVGMDVVSTELKQLGGTISIHSERGKGSRFTIRLPFTLAVTQAILVKVSDSTYAIPLASVEAVLRMPVDEFNELMQEEPPEIVYGGREHPVQILAGMMGLPEAPVTDMIQVPILVVRAGDHSIALKVDGIVGNREIVVKPVGPQISTIAGIFGATIMGDGSVVLILDVGALARQGKMLVHRPIPAEPEQQDSRQRKPVVMVVDDSITMRKVTSRVLERQDMEVFTAKDGLDALEQLQERQPDVMLLDIEMPRMDGYELATHMRNDGRLRQIPIIMVTSRTGEKHRQRAMELGVSKYLGKPYQEEELLREVKECLEQGAH